MKPPLPSCKTLLSDFITIIDHHTSKQGEGVFNTDINELNLFRVEEPTEPVPCILEPSVAIVVQGTKKIWVGGEGYLYDASKFLITSLDLPATSEVLSASHEEPCIGMIMKLDLKVVSELIAQGNLPPPTLYCDSKSVGLGNTTDALLDPFNRLLNLLEESEAIPVLAPMIQREIHYRLLVSDQSTRLQKIASGYGHGHRIACAINWLKNNYTQTLRIDELATHVKMSVPSFHMHFRQMTGMSPLQYQKRLRLNEARRLMFNEYFDVSGAAFRVGYESPSQFSREYSRIFGFPPKKDIALLRKRTVVGGNVKSTIG
jgi:AraC-like DNA-binding protein